MDERKKPTRRSSMMRLLAAALAGGIGAFGIPAGALASQAGLPALATPPVAAAPDGTPE